MSKKLYRVMDCGLVAAKGLATEVEAQQVITEFRVDGVDTEDWEVEEYDPDENPGES